MDEQTFSAGESILARCTKCRKNDIHIIVTLSNGIPAKVRCTLCEREHPFRPPTAPAKPAVRRPIDPKNAEREEWQRLRPDMNGSKALNYSMEGEYRVRALIEHPLFGLGVVQRIMGDRKIEVLFEGGKKIMRCR
jgi:hypothetical protein